MIVLYHNDSDKHWSVDQQGAQLEIVYWYGENEPQTMVKKYESEAEAKKAQKKYVADRVKKGFVVESDDTAEPEGPKKKSKSKNLPKKAFDAIRSNNMAELKEAIEAGVNANDSYKDTSLFEYAIAAGIGGNLEPIKLLSPTIVSYIGFESDGTESKFDLEHQRTLATKLLQADLNTIKAAIESGFDIRKDPWPYVAVGVSKRKDVWDYIYSIIPLSEDKGDSMVSALEHRNEELVYYLLDKKADLGGMDYRSGQFVMNLAVSNFGKNPELVRALINAGADVNVKSLGYLDHYDATKPRNGGGVSPLEQVYAYPDIHYDARLPREVEELIEKNGTIDLSAEEALEAARTGRMAAVKAYIEKHGTNARDSHGRGLLHYAMMKYDSYQLDSMLKILIKAGIDMNMLDNDGRNALFYINVNTYYAGSKNIAQIVAKRGTDINQRDKYGLTPIMFHATQRPDQPSNHDNEHDSLYSGRSSALKCIAAAGADLNVRFEDGKTIFHHLLTQETYYEDTEILRKMIGKGGNVNLTDNLGRTPLHYAATSEYNTSLDDNLEVYITKGNADINAQDNNGDTPLHRLIIEDSRYSVGDFLRMGAKTDIKNNEGKTVIDLMVEKGVYDSYKNDIAKYKDKAPTFWSVNDVSDDDM